MQKELSYIDVVDQMLNALRDPARPTVISPERFASKLSIDSATLASLAHIDPAIVVTASGDAQLQQYMHDAVRVIAAGTVVAGGDSDRALQYFGHERLATFDFQTAARLVADGRVEDVLRYFESIEAGPAG